MKFESTPPSGRSRHRGLPWLLATIVLGAVQSALADRPIPADVDRSPVDLALTADERWLFTANQTSDSMSQVDLKSGRVVAELPVGRRPVAIQLSPDGRRLAISCVGSGELHLFDFDGENATHAGVVEVGFEPRGVAIAPDGKTAYVAQTAGSTVAVVDLDSKQLTNRIAVGRWPRYLTLSLDGSRLAVGSSGDRGVSVVDTADGTMQYLEQFSGLNIGQIHAAADGLYAYFPWIIYRQNTITESNIRQGWVLASRIARVRLDGPSRREAMSLDVQGKAVADPHGLSITPDGQWLVCSASGSQELLVYRMRGLVFQDYGGPGDLIDAALAHDSSRFFRVPLGGRPMAIKAAADSRHVYVTNYLDNSVQVVDLQERAIARTISLGGAAEPSLVRRGEAIFFDGRRSLDQWYSCHSCHYEGDTNSVPMDTTNDGSPRTFKTVLSLRNVWQTAPWTWHGWQQDLREAMHKSMTETMLGPEPTEEDITALLAYLQTLAPPPSPFRGADGGLSEAAQRGKAIFDGEQAGCAQCHSGPLFSDGEIHDVGLAGNDDVYEGFNTPSLVGLHNRVLLLHDGRGKSLEQVLTGPHSPAKVSGTADLTAEELADLVEYLKTL